MLEAYKAFLEKRLLVTLESDFVTYDWHPLPNELPMAWFVYSQMLDKHARELANSLNEMRLFIVNLKGWLGVSRNPHRYFDLSGYAVANPRWVVQKVNREMKDA